MKIKILDAVMVAFALYATRNVDILSYVVWTCCFIYFVCRILEIKKDE